MHVALTAVHYHADAIKGVSVPIVPDVDVVTGRLYVSVAAKGSWENIQNVFLSAGSGLADNLPQALGNVVSSAADSLALPAHRTRYRFEVFGKTQEVGGIDDNGISMHAVDSVPIGGIKHSHSIHIIKTIGSSSL